MKYSVLKTTLEGIKIHDYGELILEEIKELGKTYIPETFENERALNKTLKVIKVAGSDDWFVSGPAIISIRAIEE